MCAGVADAQHLLPHRLQVHADRIVWFLGALTTNIQSVDPDHQPTLTRSDSAARPLERRPLTLVMCLLLHDSYLARSQIAEALRGLEAKERPEPR